MSAKILIIDIETAPAEVYTFGLRKQNIGINQIKHHPYILCWAAKWLGNKNVMSGSLVDYPKYYAKDCRNDETLVKILWLLLDEADIVVGQNGDAFDIKWINELFLKHHKELPSPYRTVDTLKVSRQTFFSISHKLDYRTSKHGLGRKKEHEGFGLWVKCMDGDLDAWKRLIAYCKQDVKLLEDYYMLLRPYMKTHPNLNIYNETNMGCTACGSMTLKKNGYRVTATGKYQHYRCLNCGKSSQSNKGVSNEGEMLK